MTASSRRQAVRKSGLCALGCLVLAGALATLAAAATPKLKVVASNLNNPRKLFVGSDGAVYVVEAGTGANTGTNRCLRSCVGRTGAVVRIEGGTAKTVVSGLGSFSIPGGQEAEGPAAVIVSTTGYTVLMQDMQLDAKGNNKVGLPDAGDLVATGAGKVAARAIANFGHFEATHNPDHGAGPGPKYAQPSIDSDPYALVPFRGGYAVVDAAGNDLLWVNPSGAISVLAVFPVRNVKLTATERRELGNGAPAVLHVQSVPSSVTLGPDGALYVGELTGWPYRLGTARVWRVVPGQKPTIFATGFTNISDVAFSGHDLLVLELASQGLLHVGSPGALVRVTASGKKTVIASAGLSSPTGLAVGNGSIYISNNGGSVATGPAPHGEVVSIPASTG